MSFEIKPATRQGIIPLVGLWGGTGGGKTKTALLFARGLVGPKGRIVVADTEGGRARYYSESIPGGFLHVEFPKPFSCARYTEVIDLIEKQADLAIIDSMSHCWEGPDGVLDAHEHALDRMLGDDKGDWKKRERLNWPAWNEPKKEWNKLRARLLSCSIPLILCFRGQQKSRMQRNEKGYNEVVTDEATSPIFEKNFPFEMHVCVELVQVDGKGGFVRYPRPYAKVSHEDIRRLMPADDEQLGIAHGEAFARWSRGETSGGAQKPQQQPDTLRMLKNELWTLTGKIHGCKKGDPKEMIEMGSKKLEQHLIDEMIMSDTETLAELTPDRLREIIEKIKSKV